MNNTIKFINNEILRQAGKLRYTVKDIAPDTESGLFNNPSLIVWSGASDNTIFNDKFVNYAFRALHDYMHLKTDLNFSIESEIELGRIQANQFNSNIMQDLIYCEIAGQALYYKQNKSFVKNQVEFTKNYLSIYNFDR